MLLPQPRSRALLAKRREAGLEPGTKATVTLLFNLPFSAVDPTLFPRQDIPERPKDTQPSTLSRLLVEYDKRSANPFFEYSKFNGEVS